MELENMFGMRLRFGYWKTTSDKDHKSYTSAIYVLGQPDLPIPLGLSDG